MPVVVAVLKLLVASSFLTSGMRLDDRILSQAKKLAGVQASRDKPPVGFPHTVGDSFAAPADFGPPQAMASADWLQLQQIQQDAALAEKGLFEGVSEADDNTNQFNLTAFSPDGGDERDEPSEFVEQSEEQDEEAKKQLALVQEAENMVDDVIIREQVNNTNMPSWTAFMGALQDQRFVIDGIDGATTGEAAVAVYQGCMTDENRGNSDHEQCFLDMLRPLIGADGNQTLPDGSTFVQLFARMMFVNLLKLS